MESLETPKILYLEIDEEVTSIIDRFQSVKQKVIVLVVPNRATLLQSIVNLKLLKRQADKLNKEIALVTTDKTGRNLSSQIGITVYSDLSQSKYVSSNNTPLFQSEHIIRIRDEEEVSDDEDIEIIEEEEVSKIETDNIIVKELKKDVSAMNILEKSKKLREKAGFFQEEAKAVVSETAELNNNIDLNIKETSENKVQIEKKKVFGSIFSKLSTLKMPRLNKKEKKESALKNVSLFQADRDVKKDSVLEEKTKVKKKQKTTEKKVSGIRYKGSDQTHNVMAVKMYAPKKKALYAMLIAAFSILFVIFYFVLPNATITIQPKIEPISYTANISMLDINRYKNLLEDEAKKLKFVGSYPVEIKELAVTEEVPVSGERFVGGRTTGIIEVVNKVGRSWQFVQNTRFQSPEGLIFRTTAPLLIAGNTTAEVAVIADEFDSEDKIVGARANLEPTNFTIPGLGNQSPQYIEGVSKFAFAGGSDEIEKVVSADDIEAAKIVVVENLLDVAEQKVIERIEKENADSGTNLKLFRTGHNDSDVRTEVVEVIVDTGLIGQARETFPVAAKVRLNGIAYDIDEVVSIMESGLQDMVLDNRNLIEVQADAIDMYVKENIPGTQKVEIEATLHGVVEYSVDNRLGDRIKQQVIGKNLEESLEILENMPEIGGVKIETWPFWVKNIPGVRSNVKVVKYEE